MPEPHQFSVQAIEVSGPLLQVPTWPGAGAGVSATQSPLSLQLTPDRTGAAAWYAIRAQYGKRGVPYLAPYELSLTTNGADCWLAVYDHRAASWKLRAGPLAAGSQRVPIGLDPNAAGTDGAFRFALLATGQPVTVANIGLRYPEPPASSAPLKYQLRLPARDGTQLATDVYMPYDMRGPLLPKPPYPVILVRTPYEKAYVGSEYISWVARFNAVVVIQYFRGRPGASEFRATDPASGGLPGLFDDHAGPEHHDAVDTARWIHGRSFSSGKLLCVGASGLGLWIYQALPALGEQASAAYCIAAAGDVGNWAAVQNGCFKLGNVEGWLGSFDFPPELLKKVRAEARDPAQWAEVDFNRQAASARAPGWHETGWWDVDVEETIRSFRALSEHGGAGARGQQWLVIGPWTHEGIRLPSAGELKFPFASLEQNPSLLPLSWEGGLWSAWQLGHNPFYTPPADRVRVYFVGEQGSRTSPNNTWYTLPTWPPKHEPLTLHIDQGKLTRNSVGAAWSARFDCDPYNPIPTLGGANLPLSGQSVGPMDQRPVEDRPDVIRLRSEPLVKRLSTAGPFRARLNVSTDAADTDVIVKLLDVYPDGRSMLIADRALRLSWWCAQQGLEPVQPGRVYEIELVVGERAWVFEQGHRVGFDVQTSNYPRFDVNPGTGAALSGGKMVVQHNTLHAGPQSPSQFTLPLFDPTS